jgi:hypothetical protein
MFERAKSAPARLTSLNSDASKSVSDSISFCSLHPVRSTPNPGPEHPANATAGAAAPRGGENCEGRNPVLPVIACAIETQS